MTDGVWDEKPKVATGAWGAGPAAGAVASNMGMAQKSAAASYWEAKTTEIFIPEMGDEGVVEDVGTVVAEAP